MSMNYSLNTERKKGEKKQPIFASLKKLTKIIGHERNKLLMALAAILINTGLTLSGAYVVGYTVDHYVQNKDFHGILMFAGILLVIYFVAFLSNYFQMIWMGGIGQRMLFNLRNEVFNKLQELPLDFFNQNKSGDLISRINNDTENVNQFFSQSLMRFIGGLITMTGAGVLLLSINLPLGLAALSPAVFLWIFTQVLSPWIRRKNEASLKSLGNLSGEIQEGLANFKVVVAFNRRDYFKKRFVKATEDTYKKSVKAGIANNVLTPVYTFGANIGQLIVLALGIHMIIQGNFTIGLLISFLAYISNFYNPLRQLAALWSNFQLALAAWDRISYLLSLETNLNIGESNEIKDDAAFIEFKDIHFSYPNGKEVLHHINFKLECGKTYAFIGPTGGGKTTTASLISRLYDPTAGAVLLEGKDLKSYASCERAKKIGMILQEPILFTGTVRENILYGNANCAKLSSEELEETIADSGLANLLERFDNGLDTQISMESDGISLGQKTDHCIHAGDCS